MPIEFSSARSSERMCGIVFDNQRLEIFEAV